MQLGITYDQGNKRIVRCAVRLNPSQNIIEIRIGVTISKRHDAADVELTFFFLYTDNEVPLLFSERVLLFPDLPENRDR